jgi:hypothetical protein
MSEKIYSLTIAISKNKQWDGQRASQFMEQMLMGFGALIFRIVATSDKIVWQIVDPLMRDPYTLQNAIRASYPDANVTIEEYGIGELPDEYPIHRVVVKYQQPVETFLAPILYANDIKTSDPLAYITETMSDLYKGERIIYTIFVDGPAPEAYKKGEKQITNNVYDGSFASAFNPIKTNRYKGDITRVCQDKLAQRLYHTSVFIQLDTPHLERIPLLLTIDNHMVSFDRPGFGALTGINEDIETVAVTNDEIAWDSSAWGQFARITTTPNKMFRKNKRKDQIDLILESREIACLWHVPWSQQFTSPTIHWIFPSVRMPNILRGKKEGVCVGINDFAGQTERIYIPDRSGHISIIGRSGTGKSNLMHRLIDQDIASGKGVALIDPHGELAWDILQYSIPPHREKDVVVIDLMAGRYPFPLNMLAIPKGVDRSVIIGRMMSVLDRLYDLNSTPTVADALYACLMTLSYDPSATIRDAHKLFTQSDYRQTLVNQVTNVAVEEFWERFEQQSKSNQENTIRPVLWRLRNLYSNDVLYPILCHPDTLDINDIVQNNKILLISLKASEASVPLREQHLLGSILLSQLQQSLMIRPSNSPMFYLYVDEVQHFVTTTFESLLSESRKHKVALTTANQYLRQLTGGILDSIIGNVGTIIAFQTGMDDARAIAPYFAPNFDAEHLMHLNKYESAMITRYNEQSLPPFSMKPLPPLSQNVPIKQAEKREAYLRELSRMNYTPKSRGNVVTWLKNRYQKAYEEDGLDNLVDFD